VTGNTATCTVTINSNDPGTFTATADAVWHFTDGTNSTDVSRTTDSTHGSSGPAVKHFVDANVSIAPSAVNEVKHQHVFTISTTAFPAGTTATLTSITPHVSPAPDSISDTCANPVVNGNTATCTLTINNNTAAFFTATADAVWHFTDGTNSTDVSRTTDTTHGSSGPATKRFVDAFITITPPEATNSVGDQHTFVVSVSQDDGLPANAPGGDAYTGFAPPPDGTPVTVTLTNHDGANFKLILDTCAPPNGTTAGTCTVTFSSPTAGTVTGHASVTFDIGGVTLTRETDGIAPNSGDAIKHFAAGSVRWTKVDNAGDPLAGATFELCRTYDFDFVINKISTTPLDSPVCVTVEDNGSTDADPADGHFLVTNLPLGEYTVRETQAPPGFVLDPLPQTVDLIPGHINEAVANAFVNSRPVLKITGFGYTNQPDGPSPHGVFKGTTTYTVMLHNFGTAAAVLTSSSLVVSDNATCTGGNTLVIVGTVSAGFDSVPISLTCTYDTPNPTAITATLTVKYTTNGLERTASGSPAEITFTVNPD
jgi:hypothetical protein